MREFELNFVPDKHNRKNPKELQKNKTKKIKHFFISPKKTEN